jgi:hypothetical protein
MNDRHRAASTSIRLTRRLLQFVPKPLRKTKLPLLKINSLATRNGRLSHDTAQGFLVLGAQESLQGRLGTLASPADDVRRH